MPELTPLERRFRELEQMIRAQSVRVKIDSEGIFEFRIEGRPLSASDKVDKNQLKEWWIQQYVLKHHKRLGFSKVEGPHDSGPDFRVRVKGAWHQAEVEIDWKRYLRHKHHQNEAFDGVRFLIVLSADVPPDDAYGDIPPHVIYIDREHFREWFQQASDEYARKHQPNSKLDARVNFIAGEMQQHWVTICPDRDRSMATCPDCNSCAYFGDGTFGEATGAFQRLAIDYAASRCMAKSNEPGNAIDLTKVTEVTLKKFVEERCGD